LLPSGCAAAATSLAAAVTGFFAATATGARFGDFDALRPLLFTGTGLLDLRIGTVAAGGGGTVAFGVGAFLLLAAEDFAAAAGDLAGVGRAGDLFALLAAALRFFSKIFFLVAIVAFLPTERLFWVVFFFAIPFAMIDQRGLAAIVL